MSKITYTEIASAAVKGTRELVISECSNGGFILAQRMLVKEDKKQIPVFLKGATKIENLDGLYNLRNALNTVIEKYEK